MKLKNQSGKELAGATIRKYKLVAKAREHIILALKYLDKI